MELAQRSRNNIGIDLLPLASKWSSQFFSMFDWPTNRQTRIIGDPLSVH